MRWSALLIFSLLALSLAWAAGELLHYEQTALDMFIAGEPVDADFAAVFSRGIRLRIEDKVLPSPFPTFVGGESTRVYLAESRYRPGQSGGVYVGCLVVDSGGKVTRFWPENYPRGCDGSKLSLHLTPGGAQAVKLALDGGVGADKAVLRQYQNGIYLTSNDVGMQAKLFFAGIAGWFAGWFI